MVQLSNALNHYSCSRWVVIYLTNNLYLFVYRADEFRIIENKFSCLRQSACSELEYIFSSNFSNGL
jgi:hypothetical protein